MYKIMKKLIISVFIISIITSIINIKKVKASSSDTISNIDINIEVNEDGLATITEIWEVNINSGTEMYKPFYDLSTSEINILSVTDETGTQYTEETSWYINATQDEKTGKYGIYTSDNETDICWGIGEYGNHTYTIKYTISNFVQQYNDYQLIYFTLIQEDMDPVPENVTITLSSSFSFDSNEVSVNGEGYSGTAEIEDGKAIFKTNGSLGDTGYMTIYIKFSENYFNAEEVSLSNQSSINSNSIDTNQDKSSSWTKYIPYILIGIIIVLVIVYIFVGRRKRRTDIY